MFLSAGNLLANPDVGLLFVCFERRRRLRLDGTASIDPGDPLLAAHPGRAARDPGSRPRRVPDCPRYIHHMQLVERSHFVP